jgi:hypothetical protein
MFALEDTVKLVEAVWFTAALRAADHDPDEDRWKWLEWTVCRCIQQFRTVPEIYCRRIVSGNKRQVYDAIAARH